MHSKCVGSTQVFGSKEKGARHLMKTVGRRKPESPAVVPSGTHGAGERKGSEGEKPQQGLWGCRERRTEGLQVYFCPLPQPALLPPPPPGGAAQPAWVLRARTQAWASLRSEEEKAKQVLADGWQGPPIMSASCQPRFRNLLNIPCTEASWAAREHLMSLSRPKRKFQSCTGRSNEQQLIRDV